MCVNGPRNVDAPMGLPLAAAHVALGHGVAGTAFCSSGRSSGPGPMQATNSQCLTRAARAIPATWLDSMSNTAFLIASRPVGEQLCTPLGNREYRVSDAARQGRDPGRKAGSSVDGKSECLRRAKIVVRKAKPAMHCCRSPQNSPHTFEMHDHWWS